MVENYFVEDVCKGCGGSCRKLYSNTSTYMKSAGGCAMTYDVCDDCWGTGLSSRKGRDLKKAFEELSELRIKVKILEEGKLEKK